MRPVGRALDDLDLPPRRQEGDRVIDVAHTDDQRRLVQHPSVQVHLPGETTQAVSIGLDLVPVQNAIHDGHIDANAASAEAQLLDVGGVLLAGVRGTQTLEQRHPDVRIARRRRGRCFGGHGTGPIIPEHPFTDCFDANGRRERVFLFARASQATGAAPPGTSGLR